MIDVARFCRSFGTLYNSGLQLLPSLELAEATVGNTSLKKELRELAFSVQDGKGLAAPLSESKRFPVMMSQMIAVGEETGSLENALKEVADYYEQDVNFRIKRLLVLVEPLALLLISIFVGFVASSIMLPLFKMSSVIRTF